MTEIVDNTMKQGFEQSSIVTKSALNEVSAQLEKLNEITEYEANAVTKILKDSLLQYNSTAHDSLKELGDELQKLYITAQDKTEIITLQNHIKSVENTLSQIHTKEIGALQDISANQNEAQKLTDHIRIIEKILRDLNKQNTVINKKQMALLKKLSTSIKKQENVKHPETSDHTDDDAMQDALDSEGNGFFKNMFGTGRQKK